MAQALIAFGGNLGDVQQAFRAARAALAETSGHVRASSQLYRTEALLPPSDLLPANEPGLRVCAQPSYLNAVCLLDTDLPPEMLLAEMQRLEHAAGRCRTTLWAPRELDLDLLAYDGLCLDTPELVVPHPHLRKRVFVLRPLVDVAPRFALPPDGATPQQLLAGHSAPHDGIEIIAKVW